MDTQCPRRGFQNEPAQVNSIRRRLLVWQISALVLTGVTRREHLSSLEHPPDLVLEHIGRLLEYVE